MTNDPHDHAKQPRLDADLAALRAALRKLETLPLDEAALRAAFRAHHSSIDAHSQSQPHRSTRRIYFAAAATGLATLAAMLGSLHLGLGRHDATKAETMAMADAVPELSAHPFGAESGKTAGDPGSDAPGAARAWAGTRSFQPLMYSPGVTASGSYSIVRVRIPLSSFAIAYDTVTDRTIEADLLVGEDGLARGIRFNEAELLGLTAVSGVYGE